MNPARSMHRTIDELEFLNGFKRWTVEEVEHPLPEGDRSILEAISTLTILGLNVFF